MSNNDNKSCASTSNNWDSTLYRQLLKIIDISEF